MRKTEKDRRPAAGAAASLLFQPSGGSGCTFPHVTFTVALPEIHHTGQEVLIIEIQRNGEDISITNWRTNSWSMRRYCSRRLWENHKGYHMITETSSVPMPLVRVPDKEKGHIGGHLSRCSSLERIGRSWTSWRHHLGIQDTGTSPGTVPPYRIPYGWRSDPVTGQRRFHSGVDIAAELASTVHAAADGKVIYSGRKGGYGYCVMIRHAYGFVTCTALVRLLCSGRGRGQEVAKWSDSSDQAEKARETICIMRRWEKVRKAGQAIHQKKEEGLWEYWTTWKDYRHWPVCWKKEHTGSLKENSQEMGVHRHRQSLMNELRAMGAEIEYDNERNTYYLKKSFWYPTEN